MPTEASIDLLLVEHSTEEIESVRDNLASEIEKRTDLLKSIVKEKYRDIVDTSDAIHSMKLSIAEVERSLWTFDQSIANFYHQIHKPDATLVATKVESLQASPNAISKRSDGDFDRAKSTESMIQHMKANLSEVYACLHSGQVCEGLAILEKSRTVIQQLRDESPTSAVIDNLAFTLNRAHEMLTNNIWSLVKNAAPDQIGVLPCGQHPELFKLSLDSSIKFSVDQLRIDISDMSYQAQIRRYQPGSFFNTQTNQIEADMDDFTASTTVGLVSIPKNISPELSRFLYDVCRLVNTIAGFDLSKSLIEVSLKTALGYVIGVYTELIPLLGIVKVEMRQRRALQFHFDMLYLRTLLNTSKSLDVIEELETEILRVSKEFQLLLDPIELYTISEALHSSLINLIHASIRLYGLLIPHLQD